MKTAVSCICMLGLAIGLSGQSGVAPGSRETPQGKTAPPTQRFSFTADGVIEVKPDGKRLTATGGVQIQIDSTIISADEADILFAAPGEQSEIQLRGNVRLRAILR